MVGASANSPEDLQRKNPPCGLPRAIREGPARCSAARDMGAICSHGVTRGWYVDSSWVAGTARQNEDAAVTPTRGKSMSILGYGPIIVHERRRLRIACMPRRKLLEGSTAQQVRAHDLHTRHCNWLMFRMNRPDPSSGPRITGATGRSSARSLRRSVGPMKRWSD